MSDNVFRKIMTTRWTLYFVKRDIHYVKNIAFEKIYFVFPQTCGQAFSTCWKITPIIKRSILINLILKRLFVFVQA